MDTLRWVAASYSNELPVYVPDDGRLLRGDRVRITSGPFTNMEAEVVVQPGGGHKDVMVRILDCLWVSLFEVKRGEYELIELNTGGKHVYTHLDNDRLSEGLHGALGRYHASIIPLTVRIRGAVPSKLFDLLPLGVPILFCGGGEGEEIVKENQLGLVSAPGDYERLSKNIRAMSHLPDEEYRQLKANCLRLSQTTFCFERQLEAYKRFLSAF